MECRIFQLDRTFKDTGLHRVEEMGAHIFTLGPPSVFIQPCMNLYSLVIYSSNIFSTIRPVYCHNANRNISVYMDDKLLKL